jgi:hypothetical protein
VNTLTTGSNVSISGSSKTTLGGNLVLLEPGFDAIPDNGGLLLLRIKSCGSVTVTSVASQNDPTSAVAGKEYPKSSLNTLTAYPNPASSIVNVAFSVSQNEANAAIKVYSISGQLMQKISCGNISKGKYLKSIDMSKLSSGIYAIVLQLDDSRIKTIVALAR